jgi:hypothetical protein
VGAAALPAAEGKHVDPTPTPEQVAAMPPLWPDQAVALETIQKVAKEGEFVVLAATLSEEILSLTEPPTPEVWSQLVSLAQGIRVALHPLVGTDEKGNVFTLGADGIQAGTGNDEGHNENLKHAPEGADQSESTEKVGDGRRKKPQSAKTADEVEKVG